MKMIVVSSQNLEVEILGKNQSEKLKSEKLKPSPNQKAKTM